MKPFILLAIAIASPLFRTPAPELRDEWEDEEDEIEIWIPAGPLPASPIDGMPLIRSLTASARYDA